MTTSTFSTNAPVAESVTVSDNELTVILGDGRNVSVPLSWYPRLVYATPEERDGWELIADGQHVHWESLDEDISVDDLLAGNRSGESRRSFQRWLTARREGRGVTLYEMRAADD